MTAGVDFINILFTHFSCKILAPKITKLCFGFEFFWHQNIGEKSTGKMFMKLTPGVDFINILCTTFTSVDPKNAKKTLMTLLSFLHYWNICN